MLSFKHLNHHLYLSLLKDEFNNKFDIKLYLSLNPYFYSNFWGCLQHNALIFYQRHISLREQHILALKSRSTWTSQSHRMVYTNVAAGGVSRFSLLLLDLASPSRLNEEGSGKQHPVFTVWYKFLRTDL